MDEEKKKERLEEIEKELRRMQKEWIAMYEEISKLLHQRP